MADNYTALDSTATEITVSADEIGGVKYPRVKLTQGADGSSTDVSSAAPLQVTLANTGANTTPVVVDLGANNDVTVTSISAGDNNIGNVDIASAIPAGTNNIGDVDVLTVPADPFGANADAAATAGSTGSIQAKLRLVTSQLDSIKTAVEVIDNSISGSETQVDVVAALPAGTNNIGDVDVLTVPADPFGANADAAATAGSTGSMQAKLRLITSQLDSIKTAVETLDNTVAGSEMQVDVVGALPAGTNAIGKLSANSGVDIGDVDVTSITPGTAASSLGKAEDAGHTSGDVGVMALGIRNDALAATAGADLDYIPPTLDSDGRVVTVHAPKAAMVTGTASVTDTTSTSLIAAGAGSLRNYITAVQFANTGSTTVLVTLQDGSGGTALARSIIPAGGGSNIYYDIPIKTTAATALYFAAGGSSTTVYASAQGYRAL